METIYTNGNKKAVQLVAGRLKYLFKYLLVLDVQRHRLQFHQVFRCH
jgi:hypothetical protein